MFCFESLTFDIFILDSYILSDPIRINTVYTTSFRSADASAHVQRLLQPQALRYRADTDSVRLS